MAVTKSKTSKLLATAAAGSLLAAAFYSIPTAMAADGDDLNVRFGGSLVSNTSYTTTEGEQMRGVLRRVVGTEDQVPGQGVVLDGGSEGLRFDAANLSLGSSGGLITQSFLAEAVFAPASGTQTSMAPIISAGGNFTVRYEGGELNYGFDTNATGSWTKFRQSVPAPAPAQEHVFSVHYIAQADGSVDLEAMLDGRVLPPVEAPASARLSSGLESSFGFGHDVHPAATTRGFRGTISAVRVAGTDGASGPGVFEYQPATGATTHFQTSWDGTLGEHYSPTAGDISEGTAVRRGNATVSGGNLVLGGGADAVVYTGDPNPLASTWIGDQGFVVETTFTPGSQQAPLGTILSVGGNFFVRYQDGLLRYGYSGTPVDGTGWTDVNGTAGIPAAGHEHVLSVAWEPDPEAPGGRMIVWLDGVELPALDGDVYVRQSGGAEGQVGFGNDVNPGGLQRGFVGSLGASRFALLDDGFVDTAFTLQTLIPVEVCEPLEDLEPANYQSVSASDCSANIIKKASMVRPTAKQANWQEEGLTAFIHFGVNTFYNQEWGHGTEDPARVDPTGDLDPEEWIRQLRDAGYRTAILTLKHHDGFMLWPTRYSDYSIASSPWKDGQGDIAKEFADAARKYGMKVGFYLSPADSHAEIEGIYGNGSPRSERTIPTLVEGDDRAGQDLPQFTYEATDYGSFFLNTLYEVLTQYGEVSEVWFDGAAGNTGATEVFDYDAYYDLIANLQPGANIAVGGRDIRWIGNEHGEARVNEWSPLPIVDNGPGKIGAVQPGGPFNQNFGSDQQVIDAVRSGSANSLHWWPAEADMKITGGWFAHPWDVPKTPQQLLGHYERTVGRNSVMLLNVPPTTSGQFAPSSVDAIDGFAAERRKAFTLDHALAADTSIDGEPVDTVTNGNTRDGHAFGAGEFTPIEITLDAPETVARVGISEDILYAGQTVKKFKVEALVDDEWTEVASSGVIGAQRIVVLNEPVTAQAWRITVTDARDAYTISDVKLWGQLEADPGKPTDIFVDCSATKAGDGTSERPFNSLEQFRKTELATGANLHFRAGVDCVDADLTFWGYGTADDPVNVLVWGGSDAPTVGGRPLTERFADYSDQGWEVRGAAAPKKNR